jgi:hypothetical protein
MKERVLKNLINGEEKWLALLLQHIKPNDDAIN